MSIQTVEINTPDSFAVVEIRQGPAGAGGGGSATWGGITGTLSAQTDLQTALNLKAPLASPALTGTPTAPTAATTTSTTQVATTAFVQQELASGVAVAKNLEFLAHNGSGATLTKGTIVYINGAVGGVPRITKAQGNNDTNSARTIGFVKADIADGANGFVIIEGELLNVSTADSSGIIGPGIQLYLSPTTPGAFTRTKPSAPNHLVYVGVVVTASTGSNLDGKILVGIQNGYELDEIHDVSISSPAAGQVIKRNAGNTLWINSAIVSADVSDATSSATANRIVIRDGSGTASFNGINAASIEAGTIEATTLLQTTALASTGNAAFQGSVEFDTTTYTYGAGAAAAHRTALGGGATGVSLFTAATPAAARTTLEILTSVTSTDSTATTQNVWFDSGASVALTAGTWQVRAFYHGSNAASSRTNVRLSASANWTDTVGRRIATLTGAATSAGPTYQSGGVSSAADFGALTPQSGEIVAIVKMTGSGTLSMQMLNTIATGTVTCFAGSHIIATKL